MTIGVMCIVVKFACYLLINVVEGFRRPFIFKSNFFGMQRLVRKGFEVGMAKSKNAPQLKDFYEKLGIDNLLDATPFSLMRLPYRPYDLSPSISETTVTTHYGGHHAKYVRNLNGFVNNDKSLQNKNLEEIIKCSKDSVFNNAAQVWNHNLYWNCMKPDGGGVPTGAVAKAIDESFSDFATFKKQFSQVANALFGSGWVWLVQNKEGKLIIEATKDGVNPVKTGSGKAILGIDVWEHAYYRDYVMDRGSYVEGWFQVIDWEYVNELLAA